MMIDQRLATELRMAAAYRRAVYRVLLEVLSTCDLSSLPSGGGAAEYRERLEAIESVASRINEWDAGALAVMIATEDHVDWRSPPPSRGGR